ncbi:CHASE3 domain-containing protein [Flavobacterium kingsejongi]|uniref:histidine kinase n=1 Tax=Flavobacterium kingsejongi TaxID=1678728 RepID=A0A2S1LTM7_9FLAO|nr:CHASE3 domain-containing protein [Flavobacterium kingsejongi]AWG27032.1 hypothetical protein FK004_18235 [Flavobacterium kingsejongi]
MKIIPAFKSSIFYIILFAISVFVIFFIAGVSNKQIQSLNKSQELIINSHKVHIQLEQLVSTIKDAETGQRGYILTHDNDFLQAYNGSRIKINQSLENLHTIFSEHPQRLENLDKLKALIDKHYVLLLQGIEVSNAPNYDASTLRDKMIMGKNVMDSIRTQTNKMINVEMKQLLKYEKDHRQELNLTPITSLFVVLFSLVVFLFSFYRINSDLKRFKRLNQKLTLVNNAFEHAESIASISHWERDLSTDKITFSDNYYRLIGYQPQEFDINIEKYMEFVHPDDLDKFKRDRTRHQKDEKNKSIYYRIIRKDGEIRFFKSTAKIITDIHGKRMIVGVTCDVTKSHKNTVGLEEKNRELEIKNTELSSFNHVASHDLQEPLRKIQMFISRIKDKDFSNLSESGQDYFLKIQNSSNRMQILIQDLLMYSRASKGEMITENINLNLLLENAKYELAQLIDDTNAVIVSEDLPTISVVPFQFQQVLINLINNSLKYSKLEETPVVTIKASIIDSKDYPEITVKKHKLYHKIVVTDNGIGFDQAYADKIFVLFHRLHSKSEYSGTGIGLAICKKIIENHQGFISASSIPDVGTTFTIFLPK